MVDLNDWEGLVSARSDDFTSLTVSATVAPAGGSWSGPFRVVGSDGNDYFVKSLETCPTGEGASLAIEHVVAEVGRLIAAPVCATSLIRITSDFAGWEPRPGVPLAEGLAHASRALDHADEIRDVLSARHQDDNRRRHAGVYALFDWCVGSDNQWLYDLDNDRAIYSHDHGLYLPPPGRAIIDAASLQAQVDVPNQLPDPADGLLPGAVEDVAQALERVTRADLAAVLNSVPAAWPVTDADLEALGWFLERRCTPVAERLRRLPLTTTGTTP